MSAANDTQQPSAAQEEDRRGFLSLSAMIVALIGAYGTFAAFAVRFLFPVRPAAKAWMFVVKLSEFDVGKSLNYRSPAGQMISITRMK